ncbi:hypothetical protein Tco_0941311 [Tanacetum coccineum]|uniref:Uncharacterized protein n=1 Tax=Tanacetum coccineum TaxID=301880 RepID=A0ABQ5DT40_9ASTR
MHNNIMQLVQKIVHQCVRPGRYSQWRLRYLWYIDTKPNGEGLRKSILSGPYVPSTVLVQAVAAAEGNPAIQQHTIIETVLNMTPENKEHFLSEKKAISWLLTVSDNDIYSTTIVYEEFGKFTSRDGESMESYYSRFYKLMNELTRNNLQVTTMQVNVQFLQQLQPEWSRFVTVVKQSKEIDTISYHTLFDILKQPSASTRHKGKEIAKPVTPQSESVSEEDSDPEQAQRDKDMQKNLALLAKAVWKSKDNDSLLGAGKLFHGKRFKEVLTEETTATEQTIGTMMMSGAVLANLIANLTLDTEGKQHDFKAIYRKQTSIDSRTRGSAKLTLIILSRAKWMLLVVDSCLIALQTNRNELENT